ncbi:aldolase/citrate lyase family protein [uncultured Roseobacter sp.]|uniref:HpcH/HpaI aldolase family protein n=1 Tax=uncultured Roseobacter sp. TaxID=114847 RepID=UPI00262BB7A7|nr:aldolase/citrate lyase family protein [uncultured Roseobacter sp.]
MTPLKHRLADGLKTRALWLEAGSPAMAEAAVYAGFRFLLIDNEHGPASIETTAHMARAIEAAGGHPMVRVAANDPVLLKRVLEMGITSIMVPLVNTLAEARAAVAACRYPPQGTRGFAGDIRASRYGTAQGYADTANDALTIMLQIEDPIGVKNAAELAEVEGVDMLFIGPYDMSGGYGKLGQTDCAEVESAIDHIRQTAGRVGMPLGTVPRDGKSAQDLLSEDFQLVIAGSEIGFAMSALRADIDLMNPDWL